MKNLFKIFYPKNSLKRKIIESIDEYKILLDKICKDKYWIDWYGEVDISPSNLAIWICVESDKTKAELDSDNVLKGRLREILKEKDYPISAISDIFIGFESQETVDRESGGNWYHHFK